MRYKVAVNIAAHPVILAVHDGDTFKLALVLEAEGGIIHAPWLRLNGVNTPELNRTGGVEARMWMVRQLVFAERIEVELHGWSFDRRVADVWVNEQNLAELLVASGNAEWDREHARQEVETVAETPPHVRGVAAQGLPQTHRREDQQQAETTWPQPTVEG